MIKDEAALIARAQAGNTDAFEELVHQHQRYVYNLALRVVGNPQEAEDLAQEAFVRAWQALPNFRRQAQFRTWLYRIVTNLCYNRLPTLRRELNALGEDYLLDLHSEDFGEANPAKRVESNEMHALLYTEMERLPESYRLLLALRYMQELSYEEIATIVNLPLGTVKTGLFRAKERLRQALHAYTLEEEPVWNT